MPQQEAIDRERTELDLLLRGFQVSRMLRLVADLGIADRISPGDTLSLSDLAADCGVQPQPLLRILRALAAFAVFAVAPDGASPTHLDHGCCAPTLQTACTMPHGSGQRKDLGRHGRS
jgi:hypothetical protein